MRGLIVGSCTCGGRFYVPAELYPGQKPPLPVCDTCGSTEKDPKPIRLPKPKPSFLE